MVEMIWKEPPPLVSSEKAGILAELQKNPGRWALVQSRYKSTSGTTAWKKLGCDATHRRVEDPQEKSAAYDIYARWPEAKAAAGNPAAAEYKAAVAKAVAIGTALKPAQQPVPRAAQPEVRPANDMGLTKFLEGRRKRGAVDKPE